MTTKYIYTVESDDYDSAAIRCCVHSLDMASALWDIAQLLRHYDRKGMDQMTVEGVEVGAAPSAEDVIERIREEVREICDDHNVDPYNLTK